MRRRKFTWGWSTWTPQCLHLRRWGKGSNVTGTKLRFRKGDIIFGRRRAYQRKLAVESSVGWLSPTINWTTLKLEELDLPQLDKSPKHH